MKRHLAAILLLTAGCGYVEKAKQKVGLAPTPEQVKDDREAREAQQEKERQQQEREAADRLKAVRAADQQLLTWITKLDGDGRSPFDPFEGVTEPDPWGELIRVSYGKRGYDDELEVRSAGPDRQLGTDDDLARHRYRSTTLGTVRAWIDAIPQWALTTPVGLLTTLWTTCAPVGLVGTKIKGRHRRKKHPVVSGTAIALISPIIVLAYAVMFLVVVIGSLFDGDGDFDLDGGFDFFDIDIDF